MNTNRICRSCVIKESGEITEREERESMKEVRAIFFDLDDTLYDQLQPFTEAISFWDSTLEKFPYVEVFKRSRHYSDLLWDKYLNAEISLEDLRVERLVRAFQDYGYHLETGQSKMIQEKYEERQIQITLFDDVISCLAILKDKGLLTGLITNGPVEHQMRKIENLQLNIYISKEKLFISDGVGIAKPDPGIFRHVQAKLGLEPKHCCYVGDSWRNDVVPALRAGWQSIWFNYRHRMPETNDHPGKVIYNFTELHNLISQG